MLDSQKCRNLNLQVIDNLSEKIVTLLQTFTKDKSSFWTTERIDACSNLCLSKYNLFRFIYPSARLPLCMFYLFRPNIINTQMNSSRYRTFDRIRLLLYRSRVEFASPKINLTRLTTGTELDVSRCALNTYRSSEMFCQCEFCPPKVCFKLKYIFLCINIMVC